MKLVSYIIVLFNFSCQVFLSLFQELRRMIYLYLD